MRGRSHREVTEKALRLLNNAASGHSLPVNEWKTVIEEAADVDNYKDLEFVDVESWLGWLTGDHGRDDPHQSSEGDDDDEAHYEAEGHIFTDNPVPLVSAINLATVAELERAIGAPVDPLRFRANLYLEGLPAWAEFDWVGREVCAGEVRLRGAERIDRCAATNVDPATGVRDLNIPAALQRRYGHIDCGVLFEVTSGGRLEVGMPLEAG